MVLCLMMIVVATAFGLLRHFHFRRFASAIAISMTRTALPITSAGRLCPLGPLGIYFLGKYRKVLEGVGWAGSPTLDPAPVH